jgi:hypothetical protein
MTSEYYSIAKDVQLIGLKKCSYTSPATKTPWPESASELYQPSDCRLSPKLVSTLADGGVSVSADDRLRP